MKIIEKGKPNEYRFNCRVCNTSFTASTLDFVARQLKEKLGCSGNVKVKCPSCNKIGIYYIHHSI